MILIALKKNPQRNTLGSHFYGEKLAKKTYKNCITYALLGPVRLPSTFTFHATDLNKKTVQWNFGPSPPKPAIHI